MTFNWPFSENSISETDLSQLADRLQKKPDLVGTSLQEAFESSWSQWTERKHSLCTHSESAAIQLSLFCLRTQTKKKEILLNPLVPPFVLQACRSSGWIPKFVDIELKTLASSPERILEQIGEQTGAIWVSHDHGFSGISDSLIETAQKKEIFLIEHVGQAFGVQYQFKKAGQFGDLAIFSLERGALMSSLQGGIVSTQRDDLKEILLIGRHLGLSSAASNLKIRAAYEKKYPRLDPNKIFAHLSYDFRASPLHLMIADHQFQRLDSEIEKLKQNRFLFYDSLNPDFFHQDFNVEDAGGSYLFLIPKKPLPEIKNILTNEKIETFRGGPWGNQLGQPYSAHFPFQEKDYPQAQYFQENGWVLGNSPSLPKSRIVSLCEKLAEYLEKTAA